jgi:hypothetical protein
MTDSMLTRALLVALMAALLSATSLSIGQEGKAKAKGRLPAYYAAIVTPRQRDEIYALQDRYAQQIAALREQLAVLTKQRDAEMENVLSDDQKEKLKQARENAAAKRKKSAAERKSAEAGGGADAK